MNVYENHVTKGAWKLSRRWESQDGSPRPAGAGGGGRNAKPGMASASTAGRVRASFSPRSRRAMRYEMSALPWELLRPRPAMVTLTYPAKWRHLAPDARAVVRQREALKEWWRRNYGPPIGMWVMEFQPRAGRPEEERNAPHIHMYVGLPAEAVSDDEWHGLIVRMLERKRNERLLGKYDGRSKVQPISGPFSESLLGAWYRIVGSGEASHLRRGVDIMPVYWSDDAAANANPARIAEYFWRESGKLGQKSPPKDFGGLAFYGRWGKKEGFEPVEGVRPVEKDAWMEMRRVAVRLAAEKLRAQEERMGVPHRRFRGPRGNDGVVVFDLADGVATGSRVEAWALETVMWKRGQA